MRLFFVCILFIVISCTSSDQRQDAGAPLRLEFDKGEGSISVLRGNEKRPLLVHHAKDGARPYIHPIVAPDGKGELTEFSPEHRKHQTGLYWGLKEVNGRDYFMNWKSDYWKHRSAEIFTERGRAVKWKTVYDLLDKQGNPILTETQTWSFTEESGRYVLDLVWEGEGRTHVTMSKFYVGGLFVRMPWHEGIAGEAVNAVGQRNNEAEGQRAIWNDIGIVVPGRTDMGHIAILDHPDNNGFPSPWRVDNQLGVGPSRQILGDWSIAQGEKEVIRYRIIVYTGNRNDRLLNNLWKDYVCQ